MIEDANGCMPFALAELDLCKIRRPKGRPEPLYPLVIMGYVGWATSTCNTATACNCLNDAVEK